MQMEDLQFIKEIDLLKNIERQTSTFNSSRKENTAEHSWHLAIAAFVLIPLSDKKLHREKVLSLAIFHDIVEIDAGDTFVYSDLSNKAEQEEKTLIRLCEMLPHNTANEIKAIWYEYEANETPEAQFVNAIDRFLPIYANYLSKGFSWKKHGIKKSQVIERNKFKINLGLPKLWPTVENIMNEAIENDYLINDME